MADKEAGEETAPRGNEWEVVQLTASAYAAAPGSEHLHSNQDSQGKLAGESEAETSSPMFMSGHFVFPPSHHENLPLEPEYSEIQSEKWSQEEVKSDVKDDENVSIKGLISEEFPGVQVLGQKGDALSLSADYEKDGVFDKEQSIYSTTEFSSYRSETTMGKSSNVEESEGTDASIESLDHHVDSSLPNLQKSVEGEEYDSADPPCEAWWKRRAVSLYAHAKETNTFWSIFIAAAVMGLVVIGHRWQQERWQVLHLKWRCGLNDEKMGRMLGPISRFKDVIVGGHRSGSLLRGRTSADH